MHVLRRSSSSYRLAMRSSSSVLRRSFSRDFVHRRETTGSPWNIRPGIKPRKAGISLILLPHQEEGRRLIGNQPDSAKFSRISKIPSTQQDSLKSARFPQTSKILPNQQDSLKSDRLPLSDLRPPNPADTRPRLHFIEPSLLTATHS